MSDDVELDEDMVSVEKVHDYSIHLDVDGLPEGTVAVDYYQEGNPRIIVRGDDVDVDLLDDDGEIVKGVSVKKQRR